jgi:ABC-2 type transport system permease protein
MGGDAMRRKGSPWEGLSTVYMKELTDNLSSIRMLVLELLVLIVSVVLVALAIRNIQATTAEDPFVLLKLFTSGPGGISLVFILGILVPILAIALGFDTVNGEHSRRTMSRILSQPIYRDALLGGKFLAALTTLGFGLLCLWLLVVGFGIMFLGVPPSAEEITRSVAFLAITMCYAGTWLALAILLSVVFRSAATAVLIGLGAWLFLTFLWPFLAAVLANVISPQDLRFAQLGVPTPATYAWAEGLSRISPNQLFSEAATALLSPEIRTAGLDPVTQYIKMQGAIPGAPLPLSESLAVAWPLAVALLAGVIVLFVAGYIAFQRQEVRA